MRFVVLGAGGVGGYFGARLARAGQDVTFVARGAHLAALRQHGLRVRSSVDGDHTVPVTAVETVAGLPPADAVLVCVKSFDTESALELARPVIGPLTAVLSLQNGIDSHEKIDAVLGGGHALGGVAYVFAGIESPGVIVHTFSGRIVFGEMDGRPTPRAERLRQALADAGIRADLVGDIRRALWEKYLMISAQAGMTALTRCPIGVIRDTPETWRMYRMIVDELAALGRAAGVALPPDVVETVMVQAGRLAPPLYSSLHYDLIHGRRLELEALHGHAVRLGERLGIPTPAVFAVYAALKPRSGGEPSGEMARMAVRGEPRSGGEPSGEMAREEGT